MNRFKILLIAVILLIGELAYTQQASVTQQAPFYRVSRWVSETVELEEGEEQYFRFGNMYSSIGFCVTVAGTCSFRYHFSVYNAAGVLQIDSLVASPQFFNISSGNNLPNGTSLAAGNYFFYVVNPLIADVIRISNGSSPLMTVTAIGVQKQSKIP